VKVYHLTIAIVDRVDKVVVKVLPTFFKQINCSEGGGAISLFLKESRVRA
jgi:hypothetical protein